MNYKNKYVYYVKCFCSNTISICIHNNNSGLTYSENIETKRVPTSKIIKEQLSKMIDTIIQSVRCKPDDVIDLLICKETYFA